MQQNLSFSPIQAGLAFLPMPVAIVSASLVAQTRLLPRSGPWPLLVAGMLLGAAGMTYLTGLDLNSTYISSVLPGIIILGLGFGLNFSTSINTATLGAIPQDAGLASALVSTCQQVGGAAGTALLSTIAATATAGFVAGNGASLAVAAAGAIHGYTVAFQVSAGIFVSGAIIGALLLRGGPNRTVAVGASQVLDDPV